MDAQLTATVQQWANDLLVWVGFGTLVGLMAKAIMPGRDPGGAVATLLMGIGGTVIGCGCMMYFTNGQRITPVSPMGFVVATVGAFVLLFFYRLLGGRFFYEGDRGVGVRVRSPYFSRRRYNQVNVD
ncbi:MAG TPA: GlsB/YeaQ/YmgE family stress response membrane protein [Pirellulales bacterium]|jgi:uncharacterized membrane protein YeaQ/YmgE (transglycosylase-associated protein family)|nr:GlsB/YeaQ/YmgE family stress response membrane protein [Pirellulales bacterium]